MRRALKRADDGKTLDATEVEVLLAASGESLRALMATAARVRDQGLADAGRAGIVTYSKKVFIPLTRLCRDRCHYCTFATTPGRVHAPFMSPDEVLEIARQGAALGCKEALFTLGDRPEDRWDAAAEWLEEAGYENTLDYVRAMADPGARGDRPAPPPQPRGDDLAGPAAAEAGRAEHGHDAGDHLAAAVRGEGPAPLRLARQGPGRPVAGAGGRRPVERAVHHRPVDRHRREPGRAGRLDLRAAPDRPPVRRHPGGHHPGLPGEAGHRDAQRRRRAAGRVAGRHRRHQDRARPPNAGAGPAEPGRTWPSAANCSTRVSTTSAGCRH